MHAGYTIRLFAALFDTLLIGIIPLIILFVIVNNTTDTSGFWIGILWLLLEIFFLQWFLSLSYQIITFMFFHASLGKHLAGLSIEKENQSPPALTDGLMRFLVGYTVSGLALGLGFFWIIKDPQKKGFHDHFAGTFVVKKSSPLPLFLSLPLLICAYLLLSLQIIKTGSSTGLFQNLQQDVIRTFGEAGRLFNADKLLKPTSVYFEPVTPQNLPHNFPSTIVVPSIPVTTPFANPTGPNKLPLSRPNLKYTPTKEIPPPRN